MRVLRKLFAFTLGAALIAGQIGVAAAAPLPTNIAAMKSAVDGPTQVYWRGGWGWGAGAIAGALIGGAIAAAPMVMAVITVMAMAAMAMAAMVTTVRRPTTTATLTRVRAITRRQRRITGRRTHIRATATMRGPTGPIALIMAIALIAIGEAEQARPFCSLAPHSIM